MAIRNMLLFFDMKMGKLLLIYLYFSEIMTGETNAWISPGEGSDSEYATLTQIKSCVHQDEKKVYDSYILIKNCR